MKSVNGAGLLKLATGSAKSFAVSIWRFILRANTSAGAELRTNLSSKVMLGRLDPSAISTSRFAISRSKPATASAALRWSARATASENPTVSTVSAAMTAEKVTERNNSDNQRMGTDRERNPWRGTASIVVSLFISPAHGRGISTILNRLRGRKTGWRRLL